MATHYHTSIHVIVIPSGRGISLDRINDTQLYAEPQLPRHAGV
jgi:hypothetical protein